MTEIIKKKKKKWRDEYKGLYQNLALLYFGEQLPSKYGDINTNNRGMPQYRAKRYCEPI